MEGTPPVANQTGCQSSKTTVGFHLVHVFCGHEIGAYLCIVPPVGLMSTTRTFSVMVTLHDIRVHTTNYTLIDNDRLLSLRSGVDIVYFRGGRYVRRTKTLARDGNFGNS